MCKFNMSLSDSLVDEMRPLFADEKKMMLWMQVQIEKAMRDYTAKHKKASPVNGEEILLKLQSLPDMPEGFLLLGGVLGETRNDFSWNDLREGVYVEKYGI